jgi:hypothetical protein
MDSPETPAPEQQPSNGPPEPSPAVAHDPQVAGDVHVLPAEDGGVWLSGAGDSTRHAGRRRRQTTN